LNQFIESQKKAIPIMTKYFKVIGLPTQTATPSIITLPCIFPRSGKEQIEARVGVQDLAAQFEGETMTKLRTCHFIDKSE
jgi:hypothetical protein